jgi:hypothetical protein
MLRIEKTQRMRQMLKTRKNLLLNKHGIKHIIVPMTVWFIKFGEIITRDNLLMENPPLRMMSLVSTIIYNNVKKDHLENIIISILIILIGILDKKRKRQKKLTMSQLLHLHQQLMNYQLQEKNQRRDLMSQLV